MWGPSGTTALSLPPPSTRQVSEVPVEAEGQEAMVEEELRLAQSHVLTITSDKKFRRSESLASTSSSQGPLQRWQAEVASSSSSSPY